MCSVICSFVCDIMKLLEVATRTVATFFMGSP